MKYNAEADRKCMPDPKPAAGAKPVPSDAEAVAAAVGRLVRAGRAKRGMTRRQLAHASGASERYLAQIEGGAGNPSVVMLAAIAEALDVPIIDLLPRPNGRVPGMARILDLIARAPATDLPGIAELLEACTGEAAASDRARRIALIGLRGAGKSALGGKLAGKLEFPFIELDRLVEQDYGAPIPDLIEISGLATFRRYERACLDRIIAQQEAAVIATAGGIVSNAETFALLLRRTHTVWIKARPDEHMSRVMQQGDFRPMAKNREAMADLLAILDSRTPDYARAHAELDTSGDAVERSCEKLLQIARRCLANAPSRARRHSAGEMVPGQGSRGGPT
jgi:XRE family transcriptional regulator, aerobic/anaerobic benzoate catabolism transcriptional regulator